ncbi:MAG: MSMEG_0567/Sll0786 family nitrogen starvation N-acetyltransferase [Thermodesulfobacteriota bacterium]
MEKFIFKIAEGEKELEGYFHLRRDVFVKEQKIFGETDIDKYDTDPFHKVIHIVSAKLPDREIIGAVRCYRKEGDTWVGGRLSVAPGYRNGRVGAGLVRFAVQTMRSGDCKKFLAYVQPQNIRFFIRLGWTPVDAPEVYQGFPHQLMEVDLDSD